MEEMACYMCDEEFTYSDDDVCTTNDICEGQYVEFDVVMCPHCEMSVRV